MQNKQKQKRSKRGREQKKGMHFGGEDKKKKEIKRVGGGEGTSVAKQRREHC